MNLILTNRGADLASAGFITGNYPSIVKVKLGDGGGVDVVHDATALDIINSVFETDIVAGIRENDVITMMFTVPFNVGGFIVREIGVYTANDELIAVSDRVNWEKKSMDDDPTEINVHMKLTMSSTQGMGIVFSNDDIYASKKALAETNNSIILVAKNIREEIEVYKESVKQSVVDDTFHASVKGTVTTDGRMNLVKMKDVNLEVALGLDVGDVIKINSESFGSQLTPSEIANNVNPPFRHMCTFKNDVYAVVHGGDGTNRGVWKQVNGKGVWNRVLNETLLKPSIASDGEYLYLTRENGRVQKVNRVVLVEGKDKEPVLDDEGRPTYEQVPRLDENGNHMREKIPVLDINGDQVYEQVPQLDDDGNQMYEQIPVLDDDGNPTYEKVPVLDDEGNPTYEQVPVVDENGDPVYEQIPVVDDDGGFIYKYTQLTDALNAPIFGEVKVIDGTNPEHPDYPEAVEEMTIYKSPLLNNFSTNIIRVLQPDGTVNEIKLDYVEDLGYVVDTTFIPPVIEDEVDTLYNYEPTLIHDGVYYKEYRYKIVSKKKTYRDGDQLMENGDPITTDGDQIFVNGDPLFTDGDPVYTDGELLYDNGDQIFTPAVQEVLGNDLDFNRLSDLTNVVRRFSAIAYNPVDRYLYTAVYGGLIYRVDRTTGNEIVNSVVARDWNTIVFHPTDGNIYAAEWNGLIYTKFGADYEDVGITGKRFYNQLFIVGESLAVTIKGDSPYRISLASKTLTKMNNLTPTTLDFVGGAVTLRDITYFASDKGIFTSDTGSSEIIRTVSMLGNDEIVDFGNGNKYNLKTGEILVNIEGSGWKDNTNLKLATSIDLEDVTVSRVNKYYHRASDDEIEDGIVDFRFVTPKGLRVLKQEVDSAIAVATQPGEYRDFAMINPKGRWMYCNGNSIKKDIYPELYEAIGDNYIKPIKVSGGFEASRINPERANIRNFYNTNNPKQSFIGNITSPHGGYAELTYAKVTNNNIKFKNGVSYKGDLYLTVENGDANTRGIWKLTSSGGLTRVLDMVVNYGCIETDGTHLYFSGDNIPVYRVPNGDFSKRTVLNNTNRRRFGMSYDKTRNTLVCSSWDHAIYEINISSGVEDIVSTDTGKWMDVVVLDNGRIFVANYEGYLYEVNRNNKRVTHIPEYGARYWTSLKRYGDGILAGELNKQAIYINYTNKTARYLGGVSLGAALWGSCMLVSDNGVWAITNININKQNDFNVNWKTWNGVVGRYPMSSFKAHITESDRLDSYFDIPDRRGLFPRTLDNGKGVDPDKNRKLGSVQGDSIRKHSHMYRNSENYDRSNKGTAKDPAGKTFRNSPTSEVGGDETRPVNITVYTCISY